MTTEQRFERVVTIVLDSVGIGELPDAAAYGDVGASTLGNISKQCSLESLVHLGSLGLGNIEPLHGLAPAASPRAAFGKMAGLSPGKDTTTGHWEFVGIILDKPFAIFHGGFPPEIISAFSAKIGRGVLGNCPASGTEIIAQLGEEHMRTGKPIVYTSADSVFQIAAHEEIIPLEQLYEICHAAREIVTPYNVGRVIARPFTGSSGNFTRTANRKDFADKPPRNLLNMLHGVDIAVHGIGKIENIYDGSGIAASVKTKNNREGMLKTIELAMRKPEYPFIFTNLVDFDMLFGHRRDVPGYHRALVEFDLMLPELLAVLAPHDLLLITADHGCDPSFKGTDHTREYVPLLAYSKHPRFCPANLGVRSTFADLGMTIAENFGVAAEMPAGKSFLSDILD